MSDIPSNNQLREWYKEVLQAPSFIDTLNSYQKEKLLQYSKKELDYHFRKAASFLESTNESNYPPGLPMANWLEHIVYRNMGHYFNEATFVLNQFGWHWTLEKSFHRLVKPQPKVKIKKWKNAPIKDINTKWEYLINQGETLTQRQIALVCHYEGIHIPKPSDSYQIADLITQFHGHKSGLDLYNNHYLKVRSDTDRLNQHKTKKDIETAINFLSSGNNVNKAIKDLIKLDDKIRKEEN